LVDLAVVEQGIPRVLGHYRCLELPLNDLSLLVLAEDSNCPDMQTRLRYYSVYSKYLKQYAARRVANDMPDEVTNWYNSRLDDMNIDMSKRFAGI
jgi:hypothetical protein